MFTTMLLLSHIATLAPQGGSLSMDPQGAVTARLGYFPVQINLSETKPKGVKKEPTYRTTPKYGTIKLGNGPKSTYLIALDEPSDADYKIYIDKNQNGDLSDDGDGAWNKKRDGERAMYGVMDVTLRASYGTSKKETSSAEYALGFYRFVRTGENPLLCYRESARVGSVNIDGKSHKARLVENDADGLFNKTVSSPEDMSKSRPVWLMVDINDNDKFESGIVDARGPFKLGEGTFEAKISADGSSVSVMKSTKAVIAPKEPETKPLLKAGTTAPDFVAEKWGGGDLKLSDYKGKVVIIDFWATWCGPCQKSMPHVESVYQAVKDQDVVVLGVCVWDEKAAYSKWVPENSSKYTFQFGFDPAGRGAKSIAGSLFNVSGIPTTYVIGKDGKVIDAIVGYEDNDKRLEESLKKAGIKI